MLAVFAALHKVRAVAAGGQAVRHSDRIGRGAGCISLFRFVAPDEAALPMLVMGCCNSFGVRGVGQVSMMRTAGSFLEWVGLNSTSSGTITQGFSGTSGTQILQIDFSGGVNLVVNNADSFVVKNTSSASRTGVVTLIW